MESVNKKVVILSIVLALFTTFLIYTYLSGMSSKPQAAQYTNTFVAAKTLPPNHMMVESDIKSVKLEKDYLNSNAVLNKANIIGKRLKDRIIEGEQVLADRLVEDEKSKMSYVVPAGKRAVSVNINEQSAVSYTLAPGDFVDVIASFDSGEMKSGKQTYHFPMMTQIVVQNVEVLAVAGEMESIDPKTKQDIKTVTLAVTPEEAEKLVYSSDFETIRLALRQPGDDKIVNTDGVVRGDIVSNKGVTITEDGASSSETPAK